MPYLIMHGASRFADFIRHVFGGEEIFVRMRDDNSTIMHAEVRISGCTIMYADATADFGVSNANFFIYVENADASFEKALSQKCTVVMPLANQDYGRSGGVKDPFGNTWWITSVIEK